MRWAFVFVAACRFEPGTFTVVDDADLTDDARPIDARPIDAVPVDARECPSAPFGCQVFTCDGLSSCYYYCGLQTATKVSWYGAVGSCSSAQRGCLVTINDQPEQDCIAAATQPSFPNALVWIGLRQDQPSNDEPAGGWNWQCPPSTYLQPGWGNPAGEPNDQGGTEDCAALTNGGGWFDATCSGSARYVCELP